MVHIFSYYFKMDTQMKTADTVPLIPYLAETLNIKNAQFIFV
jgi:hypothetical protein